MEAESGVSLIESLVVVVVLGFIVFLLASIPNSLGLITKSKQISLAREIALKQIEDKRNINYANLADDTAPISDPRLGSLPQGSGTVVVAACPPSVCTNSEELKQVTVTVNWTETGKPQNIILTTMIGEGGINQ